MANGKPKWMQGRVVETETTVPASTAVDIPSAEELPRWMQGTTVEDTTQMFRGTDDPFAPTPEREPGFVGQLIRGAGDIIKTAQQQPGEAAGAFIAGGTQWQMPPYLTASAPGPDRDARLQQWATQTARAWVEQGGERSEMETSRLANELFAKAKQHLEKPIGEGPGKRAEVKQLQRIAKGGEFASRIGASIGTGVAVAPVFAAAHPFVQTMGIGAAANWPFIQEAYQREGVEGAAKEFALNTIFDAGTFGLGKLFRVAKTSRLTGTLMDKFPNLTKPEAQNIAKASMEAAANKLKEAGEIGESAADVLLFNLGKKPTRNIQDIIAAMPRAGAEAGLPSVVPGQEMIGQTVDNIRITPDMVKQGIAKPTTVRRTVETATELAGVPLEQQPTELRRFRERIPFIGKRIAKKANLDFRQRWFLGQPASAEDIPFPSWAEMALASSPKSPLFRNGRMPTSFLGGERALGVLDNLRAIRGNLGRQRQAIIDAHGGEEVMIPMYDIFVDWSNDLKKLGAKIGPKGKIQSLPGDLFAELGEEGMLETANDLMWQAAQVVPEGTGNTFLSTTVRKADQLKRALWNAVDNEKATWARNRNTKVEGLVKRIQHKINARLKAQLGDDFARINRDYGELSDTIDFLNRRLGAVTSEATGETMHGASLIKAAYASNADKGIKEIFKIAKKYTGVDLEKEAVFALTAMQLAGDYRAASILEAVHTFTNGSAGMLANVAKKVIDAAVLSDLDDAVKMYRRFQKDAAKKGTFGRTGRGQAGAVRRELLTQLAAPVAGGAAVGAAVAPEGQRTEGAILGAAVGAGASPVGRRALRQLGERGAVDIGMAGKDMPVKGKWVHATKQPMIFRGEGPDSFIGGQWWTRDNTMADRFAGPRGRLRGAKVKRRAKILALVTPGGADNEAGLKELEKIIDSPVGRNRIDPIDLTDDDVAKLSAAGIQGYADRGIEGPQLRIWDENALEEIGGAAKPRTVGPKQTIQEMPPDATPQEIADFEEFGIVPDRAPRTEMQEFARQAKPEELRRSDQIYGAAPGQAGAVRRELLTRVAAPAAAGGAAGYAAAPEGDKLEGTIAGAAAGIALANPGKVVRGIKDLGETGALSWGKIDAHRLLIGDLDPVSQKIVEDLSALAVVDQMVGKEFKRPSIHKLNEGLSRAPEIRKILRRVQNTTNVDFVDSRGYLKPIAIEEALKPNANKILDEAKAAFPGKNAKDWAPATDAMRAVLEGMGLDKTGSKQALAVRLAAATKLYEPKFGGFRRSISQMYWDGLGPVERENLRRSMVEATELSYQQAKANGRQLESGPIKFVMGEGGKGKTIKQIQAESKQFRVQDPLREAHKTVAAMNLNSACPMFTIGSNGCWGDACYLTQIGAGGQTVNLYQRAAYTGEILQMTDKEIRNLNKIGGLRLNGVGDTIDDVAGQWEDIISHANERGLDLKVITKQENTLKILDDLQKRGISTGRVQVQPSFDFWWVPAEIDMARPNTGVISTKIANIIKEGRLDQAAQAYEAYFGRKAKVINGKLYRKYGFDLNQIEEMIQKYPFIEIKPRAVVASPEEIAAVAKDFPDAVITWMHGKLPKYLHSDVGGEMLNFGDHRHVIKKYGKNWKILGEMHSKKKGTYIEPTIPHTKTEQYIKKNFSPEEQDMIFRKLKESSCCQSGASNDACMNCTAHCATRVIEDHKKTLGQVERLKMKIGQLNKGKSATTP